MDLGVDGRTRTELQLLRVRAQDLRGLDLVWEKMRRRRDTGRFSGLAGFS